MGASVDCYAVSRLFFLSFVAALVVSGCGSVVFPVRGRVLSQNWNFAGPPHAHFEADHGRHVALCSSSAGLKNADHSKALHMTSHSALLGFQPKASFCSSAVPAIPQISGRRLPSAAETFCRCLSIFVSFFGSRCFQSSSASRARPSAFAYLHAPAGRLLRLRWLLRASSQRASLCSPLRNCGFDRQSAISWKDNREQLHRLALSRVCAETTSRDGDSDGTGDPHGTSPSCDTRREDHNLNDFGGSFAEESSEPSMPEPDSSSDQARKIGGPAFSTQTDGSTNSNEPDGILQVSSPVTSASACRPVFSPRVYMPIPEIVAPPGRAYPFPLPQLSSRITGVLDAPKSTKHGHAEDLSSRSCSPASLPRPSYLRLLPHYPRIDPPPVDDGLLEEIFSAVSREELHTSLEKLQDSKYIEWLLTPHRYRDTEGFLAATDPDTLRARFHRVYTHHREQLDRWLEGLRRQPSRSVRLPALTQEEKDRLLTLKVPKRFLARRPEILEKPVKALKWKEGVLAADRDLIDAGGPGGFVRNLEVEAWAALFPVDDERHSPPTGADAARRRLELATRLQIREWQEERRAMEEAAGQRLQRQGRGNIGGNHSDEHQATQSSKEGESKSQATDEHFRDSLRTAPSATSRDNEEGKELRMSARVREAAEALAKQQMLASMGLPSSVQALIARYGHITPDSPTMAAPEARSALQLLQRAVVDSETFLLGRLHRGLQSEEDIQVVRNIVQTYRERHAAHGRPPPRTGHPVEFTPAMFQDWEEAETYKEVLAVATEATKRRLEAALTVVERAKGKEGDEGSRKTGDGARQETKSKGTLLYEAGTEKDKRREYPTRAKCGEGGRPDALPVPARLLQGAAAAAKGVIGARALEAVQWVLGEEIRKEQLRRDNEEYHSMVSAMEHNVKRARDERERELMRRDEDLNLQELREQKTAQTKPDGTNGSGDRSSLGTRQGQRQSRAEKEPTGDQKSLDGRQALPTHEEVAVDRLRKLSKDLGEASGLYYEFDIETQGRDPSGDSKVSDGSEATQDAGRDTKPVSASTSVVQSRGASEGTDGRPLDASAASRPVGDIFAEMEEAMRAEWKRRLGYPFLKLYPGQLVKGKVVKVTPSFAYVHVGYVCEGELRLDEVLLEEEEPPKNGLKAFFSVGDDVFCEVIKVGDSELVLSLQTLRRIAAWEQLLALQREDRALKATVLHAHKGGLVVRVLGLRGFLPVSQLPSFVKPSSQLVGAQLRVALLQADVEKQRLLVSSRIVHIREQMKRVKPDQVVEGEVVSIHPFGVMVQFGECRGLLHLSEVSAARVERLEDVLPLGSRVRALVLHYDKPTGKIALTTKLLERYPGEMVRDSQAVYAAAMHTAETYAVRKREEKAARRQAAHQLIAALGLDPTAALGPAGEQASVGSDEEDEHIDTSYARNYVSDQSGGPHALWKGIGDDDSKVMTLLSRKLLEKAAARRRKSSGSRGKSKNFGDDGEEDGASGIELFRTEREKVLEAVKASGIQLKGAWNVPSVFEAEWETDEWLFE
ncbi:S1 RNA binding domain-containing protein [Toxoplasma gondii TgCatPRC2]|uniref:S1 RNA binding domain-containing protein n=1 Tax=Toxoplasma gondii TgCatPRC2 TaxID=1130821 RepID=A0A151HHV0_TOXGO|nr:S1 RNA binding domain-containing protein [Toxoplasma gondii TgCatPRC2]